MQSAPFAAKIKYMQELPDWHQRELPDLQITDLRKGIHENASHVHSVGDGVTPGEIAPFMHWLNGSKVRLQYVLGRLPQWSKRRLQDRDIALEDISEAVAGIVDTPVYPSQRILPHDEAVALYSHQAAVRAITPKLQFRDDEPINTQFNPMLQVVCLNAMFIDLGERTTVIDAVAEATGQAVLGSIVDIKKSDQQFYYGYGYQWRQNGEIYGAALHKAAVKKIAALTRSQLGITTADEPEENPFLEPYRRVEGYYFESGVAIALDMISEAAGMSSKGPGICRLIWEFAKRGRSAAARQELASVVKRATNNTLSLEALEQVPFVSEGMPLTLLERIEEACGVDVSMRPSSVFKEYGFMRTG